MASFESATDEYDAGRPTYPPGVYDALGPIDGLDVLDAGAGTGIASRELMARRARVTALDPGRTMLTRACERSPDLVAVVGDGTRSPFRDASFDLVCFAQAWHWLDERTRCAEVARVLRPHGRWAGWWSHARADDEAWFDRYWSLIEAACPGTHRDQRDTDWGATVSASGLFEVAPRVTVGWTRTLTVDEWMTDQVSHSYVISLPAPQRTQLVAELRAALDDRFRDGAMEVPYETWLWIATKVSG